MEIIRILSGTVSPGCLVAFEMLFPDGYLREVRIQITGRGNRPGEFCGLYLMPVGQGIVDRYEVLVCTIGARSNVEFL